MGIALVLRYSTDGVRLKGERRQTEFFERGRDYLRPMLMAEVAADVGKHPATVSRAVANKFAETPQGIVALRSLFSQAAAVEAKIRKFIETEDPARPLTDEQLLKKLESEGVHMTRRSVCAHRETLHFPSARQRVRSGG